MSRRTAFGDVELMLREYLAPRGRVVSSLPPDLGTALAAGDVIRTTRTGGGTSPNGATDLPRVAILVLTRRSAARPRGAYDAARQIVADLLNLPALTAAGRLDSLRDVESGPSAFPWSDPEVQAVQLIVRLSTRR